VCDNHDKVLLQLLFDSIILALGPGVPYPHQLNACLAGVQQLIAFALPQLDWTPSAPFGGPIEDVMTVEMLLILSCVQHIGTQLFNPKLVNSSMAARNPDLYLNSTIDSYVECILTRANNPSEVAKLDDHILRFYAKPPGEQANYQIGGSNFAILHYQEHGRTPMESSDHRFQGQVFQERVFTFLMSTKEVFLGNIVITS
jgi:hypothetical protein